MKVILRPKDSHLKKVHIFYNKVVLCLYLEHLDKYKLFYTTKKGNTHEINSEKRRFRYNRKLKNKGE